MITFEKMRQWIRQKLREFLSYGSANDVEISAEMSAEISKWAKSYMQRAGKDSLLELPAAISSEFARLITLEMNSSLSGSPRADYLNAQYQNFLGGIRRQVEYACAKGGMVFKPYICDNKIFVDCVQNDCFYPTAFTASGELVSAIFVDQIVRGSVIYTRLESHDFAPPKYTITNKAYRSHNDNSLGTEILLTEVPEWADIAPSAEFSGLEHPLFAYFKIPSANNIDTSSPLGISVFSRALPLIDEAEKQFARMLWEFEGGEIAIFASDSALKHDAAGGVHAPKLRDRLIRMLDFGTDGENSFHEFAPALRDASLINGFNAILRRIEFNCNLAYGTLSDVQQTDKTAEEVRASKQRSYSAVADMQKALQTALEQLIYAMNVLCSTYNLAPSGKIESLFEWDDSLVTDRDKEFSQRMQLQTSCRLRPELNIAWYFGCSEEKALEMMSQGNEADDWGGA